MSLNNLVNDNIKYKYDGKEYSFAKVSMKTLYEIKELLAKRITRVNKSKFDDDILKIKKLQEIGVPIEDFTKNFMNKSLKVSPEDLSIDNVLKEAKNPEFMFEIFNLLFIEDVDIDTIFAMFKNDGENLVDILMKAFGIEKQKVEKEIKKMESKQRDIPEKK